jgi:hypothetical protein
VAKLAACFTMLVESGVDLNDYSYIDPDSLFDDESIDHQAVNISSNSLSEMINLEQAGLDILRYLVQAGTSLEEFDGSDWTILDVTVQRFRDEPSIFYDPRTTDHLLSTTRFLLENGVQFRSKKPCRYYKKRPTRLQRFEQICKEQKIGGVVKWRLRNLFQEFEDTHDN